MTSLGKVWNLRGIKPLIKTIMKFDYNICIKSKSKNRREF